jgi:hypothetical protein
LIFYNVSEKFTVKDASKKDNVSCETGRKYYQQYVSDPDNDAPMLCQLAHPQLCSQQQSAQLFSYIFDNNMFIKAASEKANMIVSICSKHYREYINNQNDGVHFLHFTQEQIIKFINCIVDGKILIDAA